MEDTNKVLYRPKVQCQDFACLQRQCLSEGVLFEDPQFQANDDSVYFSRKLSRPFEWKRPHEISSNPQFIIEGATRFDINQGDLGDCWLLAAVANLTLRPCLFRRVVPDRQRFDANYAGIFHFRFWQYGKWVEVVIDDRLPTYNGKLVFLQSADKDEFWSALLEKAYAKFYGSYESLSGGTTREAMEDFTGGLTETFELDEKAPTNLFQIMFKAFERGSLIGCGIRNVGDETETQLENGLVCGHAYSVTSIKLVDIKTPRISGKIPLLRIRNPWGNETEWNGSWSDKSREWSLISDQEKADIGLVYEADGEYWMSYVDFVKNFDDLEICSMTPDAFSEEDDTDSSQAKTWEARSYEGSWIKGVTAGGCRNSLETFGLNPQYCITLDDVDENDNDDKCTLVISLMQKNKRRRLVVGNKYSFIGFTVYHLENFETLPRPLGIQFFKYNRSVVSSKFSNSREISGRFKLPPGIYCIIPSTFDPHEEGDFMLRVITEKQSEMREYDEHVGTKQVDKTIIAKTAETSVANSIEKYFLRIAGDDLEVDARELKELLDVVFKQDGFGIDLCRGMIAAHDISKSGKLGLEEFTQLWQDIFMWKAVFSLYDKSNTNDLDISELREALKRAGYTLNWRVLKTLVLRYGSETGTITLKDFVCCAVKLKQMIALFQKKTKPNTRSANFNLDEWLETTMYI